MWARLHNPGFVEFYQEFQEHRCGMNEDWQPMITAVIYL